MPPPTLDRRTLNRTYLARQLLLERRAWSAAGAVEHLVAMQAQEPLSPYVGLWSRLTGFDHAELGDLLTERVAVRGWLMRSTLHLATARDFLALRPLFAPVSERALMSQFRRALDGTDLAALTARARELVKAEPMGAAAIGRTLAPEFPGVEPQILGYAAGYLLPMVQPPPRGVWGRRRRALMTTAEHWLGAPLAGGATADDLMLRYLAAFGPATAADFRTWSGLPRAAEILERLRPRLRTFRDERGRELFDVPGAPLADPDAPAPVRFLPEYDNAILAHDDRGRILADRFPPRIVDRPSVLVDGFAAGTWRIEDGVLEVRLFAAGAAVDRAALEAEGAALLRFAAAPDEQRGVRIVTAA